MVSLYEQLDCGGNSFRLVQLQPGREGDPVRLDVRTSRLSDADDYEAVSYVWGSAENRVAVTVNGHATPINRALFDCLTALRSSTEPRLLYADAICINQTDNTEKSHQVKMMRDIYATARRVLAWLDCGAPETGAFIQLGKRITPEDFRESDGVATESQSHTEAGWRRGVASPQEIASATATLHRIMDLPYWRRAWIVQECLVARDVRFHLGRAHASWDEFTRLHMMLLDKHPVASGYTWSHLQWNITRFDHLAAEKNDYAQNKYPVPLHHIISKFGIAESTDPRDMIFAFVGLSQECQPDYPSPLSVDYGITAIELYFRVGYAYLHRDGHKPQPHRVLPPLRTMLRVTPVELLDTVCALVDPEADLWSAVDWIVGDYWESDGQSRVFRRDRKEEGMHYMDCHRRDFALLLSFF